MMAGFSRFAEIGEEMHTAFSQVVRRTAVQIQSVATANAPMDTGFLRNSIYTVTSEGSEYGQAGTPPEDAYLLPEIAKVEDDLEAYVAVGANYGVYLETGTRHMAPRPYFFPAVETVKPMFEAALGAIESQLK